MALSHDKQPARSTMRPNIPPPGSFSNLPSNPLPGIQLPGSPAASSAAPNSIRAQIARDGLAYLAPAATPALRSGTGAQLASAGLTVRAQDFTAGRMSQQDYAATLRPGNLGYQNNTIAAKPTDGGPRSLGSVGAAYGEGARMAMHGLGTILTPSRVNASVAVQPEKPVQTPATPAVPSQGVTVTPGAPKGGTYLDLAAQGITVNPFADLTDAQRDAVGDAYRSAWQRQAAGGLRGANSSSLDYYNAEQQVRGSGITATRLPDGSMSFSGNGANATGGPAGAYTSGVDFGLIRDANGNVIGAPSREELSALRDEINFNRGAGGLSRRRGPEEMAQVMLSGQSRSGRQVAAQYLQNQQQGRQAAAELQAQAPGRQAAAQGQQLQNQRYAQESGLLNQLLDADGPEAQGRIIAQLRAMRGGDSQRNAQVIYNEELINPAQPMAGTRRVPMILNSDGTASVVTPRVAPKPLPNGISRDAAIQFARQAIESGYDREAVMARLGEYGLTFEDIVR